MHAKQHGANGTTAPPETAPAQGHPARAAEFDPEREPTPVELDGMDYVDDDRGDDTTEVAS